MRYVIGFCLYCVFTYLLWCFPFLRNSASFHRLYMAHVRDVVRRSFQSPHFHDCIHLLAALAHVCIIYVSIVSDFTCKVFNLNTIFLFIPSDFVFVFKCGMRRRKRIQFWIKNQFPTGPPGPEIIFCKFHRIRLDRLFYIIILRPQLRNYIIMEHTMSGTHNDKWTDQDQNDKCSQLSYPV